jgi:hypothetical protein
MGLLRAEQARLVQQRRKGKGCGRTMDIKQLLESVKSLTPIDLSWAREVIDTEYRLRRDQQMEQERYTKQQQVRAVPRISEYERTPDAVTQAGTGVFITNEVSEIEAPMAGNGISDSLQNNLRANYKDKLHVSESGATSSHVPLRYDLIPRQLLECAAERYTIGEKIHSERGYQKGLSDRNFIINRINHIQEHWNKILHPHPKEDYSAVEFRGNIGAMLWGLGFLLEVEDYGPGKQVLMDILAPASLKK